MVWLWNRSVNVKLVLVNLCTDLVDSMKACNWDTWNFLLKGGGLVHAQHNCGGFDGA